MNPINQYRFYELGARLHRVIAQKTAINAAEMFVPLMDAQGALDNLLKGDPIALDYAKADGNALLGKLGAIFNKHFIDPATRQFRFPGREDVIDAHELTLLTSLVEKFETSLAAELNRRAIYAVPKRGLFDSYDLAEHADTQFSDDILNRMPASMRDDVRAGGRALAFGLYTAACFHLVRALEAAFILYLEAYSGQPAGNFGNLWKDGLARLKGSDKGSDKSGDKSAHGDQRIVALLQEVDSRYRTALAKNDNGLGASDMVIFFGMASSLITLMMEALSAKKQVEPRYRKLQEKVEQVISENNIDDDNDDDGENGPAHAARSQSAG